MSELKDFDWSREPTQENDHEVIYLQGACCGSDQKHRCCEHRTFHPDPVDDNGEGRTGTDTAYVRVDKLYEVLTLLSWWVNATDEGEDGPYAEAVSALYNYGFLRTTRNDR